MRYSNKNSLIILFASIISNSIWAGTMGDACNAWTGCLESSLGFNADLLILQADYSSLGYIGSETTGTFYWEEKFYAKDFTYGPGFKIEGYYNFNQENDINVNWYHYQYTMNQALPDGLNVFDSPFYGNVNLQLKPRWNAINLEFGTTIIDKRDKLRLHGGIQYADMSQNP